MLIRFALGGGGGDSHLTSSRLLLSVGLALGACGEGKIFDENPTHLGWLADRSDLAVQSSKIGSLPNANSRQHFEETHRWLRVGAF